MNSTARKAGPQATLQVKTMKNSGILLRASNRQVKSPTNGAGSKKQTRRRSQRSFSPPVKDASRDPPVGKRGSSKHRRSRSRTSMQANSRTAAESMMVADRVNSESARALQHPPKTSLNNFRTSFEQRLMRDDP